MGFTLDANAARKADAQGLEAGKHVVKITKAMALSAKSGAKGVEFDVESPDSRSARFIQVWTHNKDGGLLSGFNSIQALMVCLGVDAVAEDQIKATVWDSKAKQWVDDVVTGYPELMNKPVGILLQERISEYEGKEQKGFLINGWFCPKTERFAAEILDKKPEPKRLANMVAWLADNPIKDERKKSPIPQPVQKREVGQSQAIQTDDFADDIPF